LTPWFRPATNACNEHALNGRIVVNDQASNQNESKLAPRHANLLLLLLLLLRVTRIASHHHHFDRQLRRPSSCPVT